MKPRVPKAPNPPIDCDKPGPDGGVNAGAYLRLSSASGVPLDAVVRVALAMRALKLRASDPEPKLRRIVDASARIVISEVRDKLRDSAPEVQAMIEEERK